MATNNTLTLIVCSIVLGGCSDGVNDPELDAWRVEDEDAEDEDAEDEDAEDEDAEDEDAEEYGGDVGLAPSAGLVASPEPVANSLGLLETDADGAEPPKDDPEPDSKPTDLPSSFSWGGGTVIRPPERVASGGESHIKYPESSTALGKDL